MLDRHATRVASILGFIAALVLVAGCGGKRDDAEVILARVGDREITAKYFQQRLARLAQENLPRDESGQPMDMSTLEGKRSFLEVIIDKELMVAKAIQLGYLQDTKIQAALEHATEFQALNFFYNDRVGDPSRFVSDADLDYYYSRLGERRECDYLITEDPTTAAAARQEALLGVAWSELVARYHQSPTRPGQALKVTVPWGSYREDFQKPIFAVEKGGITEPFETEYGWWVVRVNDITWDRKPDLESIKREVLLSITKRKEQDLRSELLQQLRQERNYVLDEDALRAVFKGLPLGELFVDPDTNQPTTADQLRPLDVATADRPKLLQSYDTANGRYVLTVDDFKTEFDKLNVFDRPKQHEGIGMLRTRLHQIAEKAIATEEAERRGYREDPRVKQAAFALIEEVLVNMVQQEIVSYDENVSLEDLQEFWDKHEKDYILPERRSGNMVRCDDLESAQAAWQALTTNTLNWKQVLNQYGNDLELAKRLGKIVQVRADDAGPMPAILFALEIDEISEPFEMEGGWGIVQVTRVHQPEHPVLADIRESVAHTIRSVRQDRALRQLLDLWRDEFGVTVDEDKLADQPSWQEAIAMAGQASATRPRL